MIKAFVRNLRLKGSLSHFSLGLFFVLLLFFYKQIQIIDVFKILLILLIYALYAFTSNNHYDRYNDKLNPKKVKNNPVASGEISVGSSIMINLAFIFIMVGMSLMWFPNVLFLLLLEIFVITFYSYKAKSLPLIDILFHGLYSMTFFIIPAFVFNLELNLLLVGSFIVMLGSFIVELENEIDDRDSDKKAKLNTTAVKFGEKHAKFLCYSFAFFMIILIFIGSVLCDRLLFLGASVWPIYLVYSIRKKFN